MPLSFLLEANKNWANAINTANPEFAREIAKGQNPELLFIGCSDSRVPAAQIMGLGQGDVFVHRNVANLVLHTDSNIQSVIEYAVSHLHVRHIVVCGHTGCGGVQAAFSHADLGLLNPWIRTIKDVLYANKAELDELEGDDKVSRLVELNVKAQCLNVAKTTSVQVAQRRGVAPRIHGWVFHLETGYLEDLHVDLAAEQEALASVFGVDK